MKKSVLVAHLMSIEEDYDIDMVTENAQPGKSINKVVVNDGRIELLAEGIEE